MNDSPLFPDIEPFNSGYLKVSNIHSIYYEECGNPKGKPVVFLHGGPGSGISPSHRTFFHPEKWRVILFDQRGAGKSTPFAELKENTTWDLVSDIEKIREHLHIQSWTVFGGSWGSTLALAYSQTHSSRVTEIILRGIFTARKEELHWFYQEGASYIFPDLFEAFVNDIPEEERSNLILAYYKRLTCDHLETQMKYAKKWSQWEGATLRLLFDEEGYHRYCEDHFTLAFARIECHYFYNKGFFRVDGELLQNISKIRHIPAVIIQGRYDIPCPTKTAWDLHKAWPEAKFIIVPDAGHSSSEFGITTELVKATEEFAKTKQNG